VGGHDGREERDIGPHPFVEIHSFGTLVIQIPRFLCVASITCHIARSGPVGLEVLVGVCGVPWIAPGMRTSAFGLHHDSAVTLGGARKGWGKYVCDGGLALVGWDGYDLLEVRQGVR